MEVMYVPRSHSCVLMNVHVEEEIRHLNSSCRFDASNPY